MSHPAPSIETESQYRSAVRQLEQDKTPPFLLRLLMNALESYRQARKMGWSRPQNKYGLTVFRSFRLDRNEDQPLIDLVMNTFLTEFAELDDASSRFVRALHLDPHLMGFVFVHDGRDEEHVYEGVTLSFGRVASGRVRHRDSLDLILESEIKHGHSQGLSRVRGYVDPFKSPIKKHPARVFSHQPPHTKEAQELFLEAVQLDPCWLEDAGRSWQHWTQRYINYFGPRTTSAHNSCFPTVVDQPAAAQHLIEARKLAS